MNFILRRRKLGMTSCKAIATLSTTGLQVVRNDGRVPQGDVVFRWGCTSDVEAKVIVNQSKAIHLVSDKTGFRKILDEKELCPKTWFTRNDPGITYPCVVRPQVHHQGRHLYVCNDKNDLAAACLRCGLGAYISKLIDKVAEYRVFVVQGRVVCVASKTPAHKEKVAWNVYQGGKFENVKWGEWPLKAVRMSIEAFMLSGLDFGGVDVMVDKDGGVTVLEINSAPSLTSPYRQQCFTKAFDWIVKKGKAPIPLVEKKGGYLKFIHPTIDEGALV